MSAKLPTKEEKLCNLENRFKKKMVIYRMYTRNVL